MIRKFLINIGSIFLKICRNFRNFQNILKTLLRKRGKISVKPWSVRKLTESLLGNFKQIIVKFCTISEKMFRKILSNYWKIFNDFNWIKIMSIFWRFFTTLKKVCAIYWNILRKIHIYLDKKSLRNFWTKTRIYFNQIPNFGKILQTFWVSDRDISKKCEVLFEQIIIGTTTCQSCGALA